MLFIMEPLASLAPAESHTRHSRGT
jgi:hypothetical protein